MRKLRSLAFALALAFSVPVLAGTIDIGGYCDSEECMQQADTPLGTYWIQQGASLWQLMR